MGETCKNDGIHSETILQLFKKIGWQPFLRGPGVLAGHQPQLPGGHWHQFELPAAGEFLQQHRFQRLPSELERGILGDRGDGQERHPLDPHGEMLVLAVDVGRLVTGQGRLVERGDVGAAGQQERREPRQAGKKPVPGSGWRVRVHARTYRRNRAGLERRPAVR